MHLYKFQCIIYILRIYQERDDSLHSHPQQRHSSKKLINNKRGGIAKSHAAYKQRDIWWTQKHASARAQACECNELAIKHGANNTEQAHNIFLKYSSHFQKQPVYLHMIPTWQIAITFGLNLRVIKSIRRNMKKYPRKYQEHNFDHDEFANCQRIIYETLGLNPIREKLDDFNHAYLYFDNIDRTQQKQFKGFNPSQCKGKKSRIKFIDHEKLIRILFEADTSNWNQGKPFADLHQLMNDEKYINNIRKKLKYRMDANEIKRFIKRELLDSHEFDDNKTDDNKNDDDDKTDDLSLSDRTFETYGSIIGKKIDVKYVICIYFH